jgi:hypothetical protein
MKSAIPHERLTMNRNSSVFSGALLVGAGLVLGRFLDSGDPAAVAQPAAHVRDTAIAAVNAKPDSRPGPTYLQQTPGVTAPVSPDHDYGLGDGHHSKLLPYPSPCLPGDRTPFDLWRYAGRDRSSWGSPQMHLPFEEWIELHRRQKPKLMAECQQYMAGRYDFHARAIPEVFMSGGWKPVPAGPVARLPEDIESWEELGVLAPGEIRSRGSRHIRSTSGSTAIWIFRTPTCPSSRPPCS